MRPVAAFGIYAVLSYAVTQRRMEIALRMALGATPADIARLIARDVSGSAILGGVVGLGAAVWLQGLLAKLLFGITGADPVAYAFAVLALLVVAFAASIMPACRAASADPARALKAR